MASTPQLTAALLDHPAQHSARVIAAAYLRQVAAQLEAFSADPDTGFHDLRVALRRLRSWLRAYRPELDDTIRRKTRRRAAKVARATNEPRDLEAMLEWIGAQRELSARERSGVRWLAARLEAEHARAQARARKVLNRRATKLVARLAEQLQHYQLRREIDDPAPPSTMADVTRDALVAQADRFARAIARVESLDDADRIHRVRIAAKRLRYLVETIPAEEARGLAERLSQLQDVLGASHDMHGTTKRLVRELGELGARDARVAARKLAHPEYEAEASPRLAAVRAGLHALIVRARERERATYDEFRAMWNDERVTATLAEVRAVSQTFTRL